MSASVGSVFMDVDWNVPKMSKDLERGAAAAASKASTGAGQAFMAKFDQISGKLVDKGKQMTVGLSLPVAAGLAIATKGAADLEQAVGGTGAVFKAQQSKIEAFAKGAADSVGLSEKSARTFTTRMGASLTGMGFNIDQAAESSIRLTQIGADLASVIGGTTTGAVEALNSALIGEFDPLQRLGVTLTADMVAAKAVEMGLTKTTGAVSQNAKAQATLALITEKSAFAQGNFGREADTASGAAQIGAAKAENAADDLGKSFLPIYTQVSKATAAVAQGFQSLPSALQTGVAGFGALAVGLGPVIFGLGKVGQGISAVVQHAQAMALSSGSMSAALGTMALRAGAATVAVAGLVLAWNDAKNAQEEAGNAIGSVVAGAEKSVMGGDFAHSGDKIATYQEQISILRAELNARNTGPARFNPLAHASDAQDKEMIAALEKQAQRTEALRSRAVELQRTKNISIDQAFEEAKAERAAAEAKKDGGDASKTAGDQAAEAAKKYKESRDAVAKLSGTFFGVVDAQQRYGDSLKGIKEAEKSRVDAVQKIADAQRSYQDSVRRIGDAQRSYRDALDGVADAEQGVADAEETRRESLRKVEDAQRGVVDAQEKLNEALAGPTGDDQLALDRAQLALERSRKGLKPKGGFDDKLDKRAAELDVRSAEADLRRLREEIAARPGQAAADLQSAQDQLASAQRDAVDAANGVADAAKGVTDAQRGVADAGRAVGDAQRDADSALRGVRDAQSDAAGAADAVKKAQQDAATAAIDLHDRQTDLSDAFNTDVSSIAPLIESLETVKTLYPEVAAAVDPYLQKLKELQQQSFAPTAEDAANADKNPPPPPELRQRASGGPIWAGGMFSYNEKGIPELFSGGGRQFMLGTGPGEIIPLDKVTAKAQGGVTNHFNMPNVNPRQLAAEVSYRQGRAVSGRTR